MEYGELTCKTVNDHTCRDDKRQARKQLHEYKWCMCFSLKTRNRNFLFPNSS